VRLILHTPRRPVHNATRRMTRIAVLACAATLLGSAAAHGQSAISTTRAVDASVRRSITAIRVVGTPPIIDGRLDDAVWRDGPVATGFVQLAPASGRPATDSTEARIAIDDHAIYVAMRMYDSAPDSIGTQLGRRDATGIFADWAHVIIDSYNDRRTAFRFSVTPGGVQKDVLHYDDQNEDVGWDAVWEVATRIDSLGWTAEFRIPLSQLRFSDVADDGERVWGINFGREVARRQERSFWSPILQDVQGFVSRSGELRGLPALSAPRRFELLPYTLARVTRAPGEAGDPFYRRNDVFGAAGADLKIGVTSNLTLTATINPDFGQVEADPSVVNLSAFETFFAERRPFFTEGADIFRFRLAFGDGDGENEQLFYSRRVGRAPQGAVPDDAAYSDTPEAATILGAAKLSGKTASGWSIGVLDAVTAPERARYIDGEGREDETDVEPLTNYAVVRVMKDFREGESTIGGIFTATNRRLDDASLDFLRTAAYTGGIDLRHRFGGGSYEIVAKLLASHLRGSAEAIDRVQRSAGHYFQRPDADHIDYDPTRTSLTGAAAMFNIGEYGGSWRWSVGTTARSPGFEVNDVGYQTDADWIDQFVWVGYRDFTPGRTFRSWGINFNQWAGWSFGGERVSIGGNVNGNFQLGNYWGGYGGINRNLSVLSTSALRGGPAFLRPARTNYWFGMYTDQRRAVAVTVDGWGDFEDETDGRTFGIETGLRVRPSSRLELSLAPEMRWHRNAWQYVTQKTADDGTHYVFGRLEQRTASLTARFGYTFTPTLSLQFYAQPFVSAGDYDGFMEVADPRADRFDDRFLRYGAALPCGAADPASRLCVDVDDDGERTFRVDADGDRTVDFTFGDPAFNFKELRSNLVLRWEYRPGSALYLVWSQGRSDTEPRGDFDLGRDGRRLFDAPGTNILMVKFSYWLDL